MVQQLESVEKSTSLNDDSSLRHIELELDEEIEFGLELRLDDESILLYIDNIRYNCNY